MAESTLSLGYPEFLTAVGKYLGYGRDTTAYTANQTADAKSVVESGYRQFIAPPALEGERTPHTWMFLAPNTTLAITSSAEDYTAPDSFGGLIGDMFINTANVYNVPIKQVPINEILMLRSSNANTSSYVARPERVAVRPVTHAGTTGTRFEFIFWPYPDASYTLDYRHNVLVSELTTAAPYPLGGMIHGELILQSCLAVAEVRRNEERGVQWSLFQERLRASIGYERKSNSPQSFGIMHDPSSDELDNLQRRRTSLVTTTGA
jgi:hypothetical protein